MSKYWRWCARRGGRCVKPDHADAFSTIGATRATPNATRGVDSDKTPELTHHGIPYLITLFVHPGNGRAVRTVALQRSAI
jgi:hypothetical protein